MLQVDNIKNEAILRDFLRADGLVPMRFAIFPLHLSKVLRLPRKKWCQVIRSAAPVTQNHLSKPTDLMLQNATVSRNQRPDLLTSLMNMSFVLRLPREMHLSRSSSNVPRLPSFRHATKTPYVLLTFGKVQNPLRLPRKTTSEPSKVVRACVIFSILTSKCASGHNGVHFFDIWTSTCVPRLKSLFHTLWLGNVLLSTPSVFNTLDFQMCFAPQRPALFPHRRVVRRWCVLYILTCTRASRHNDVQIFISHLARWLCTRRFSEPTFGPLEPRTCIFFPLTFSLLWSSFLFSSLLWLFPPLLFHLSICRKFDF